MTRIPKAKMARVLAWCRSVLGPVEIVADRTQRHGARISSTSRISTRRGFAYLKVHEGKESWENEVHAYKRWTRAFGDNAPRLLAVRATTPRALVLSELPGTPAAKTRLSRRQQRALWRAAGAALRPFHQQTTGRGFGSCARNGSFAKPPVTSAVAFMTRGLAEQVSRAIHHHWVGEAELETILAACALVPSFADERPVPCHCDYIPANWLVRSDGAWAGVIDFEFAHWNVRMADFARDPDWNWIKRPDLFDAFCEGYGRPFSRAQRRQLLVSRVLYALSAITWGHDNEYFGFAREGHTALAHLARTIG